MVWWGRLGPRFAAHADEVRVRWTDPHGVVVQDEPARRIRRTFVGSSLSLVGARTPGTWLVEARFEDAVIDSRRIEVQGVPQAGRRPARSEP